MDPRPDLPRERIDRVVEPLQRFLHVEATSGVVLLLAAVVAFAVANSAAADAFAGLWKTRVSFGFGAFQMEHSLKHWVNDGLMGIFFFVVGLEVKRELVLGELRDIRQATLPMAAALGGMLVPAGVFLAFEGGGAAARGWGIPMATDIAFVVGCLALLGSRVPASLRVLLLSLAIADDIGAILVIAIGYTSGLNVGALLLAFAGLGLVVGLRWVGVRSVPVYVLFGSLIWLALHESGVHATLAGVALGLLTPSRPWVSDSRAKRIIARVESLWQGDEPTPDVDRHHLLRRAETAVREALSPLERLENRVHPWSAFVIMPVFALANAGVTVDASLIREPVALAVAAGLVVGKPLGILGASYLAVRLGVARLPGDLSWRVILAGGLLAGIGFTMSLFIAGLALDGPLLPAAKVGVLVASVICGAAGMLLLRLWLPAPGVAPRG